MSLTGRSRCTSCLAYVSTALFLELDHLCHNCYQGDEDYPLQSTPGETIDAANECRSGITYANVVGERTLTAAEVNDMVQGMLSEEKRERLEANGWRVGSAEEFLKRTEETSPTDIDPVAI
jgi:hypothetical protein